MGESRDSANTSSHHGTVDGLHPNQVDFALLTINEKEGWAVREVFAESIRSLHPKVGNRGSYAWGQLGHHLFVHASTCDGKGPIATIEMIRELDQLYRPQYLLVLGTAGGIQAKQRIKYGQIVFSSQVHTGYVQFLDGKLDTEEVIANLFDDPVLPPLRSLYFHAVEVALKWEAKAYPKLKEAISNATDKLQQLGASGGQQSAEAVETTAGEKDWKKNILGALESLGASEIRPEATEIYSGPFLIDGKNSQIFKGIQHYFPKVGAVEMEAGAVAQAVLHTIGSDRLAGYLVIKGISDVIDSIVPPDQRKPVRKILSEVASLGSAQFAKTLIASWKGEPGKRYGLIDLMPPFYQVIIATELVQKPWTNSVVYYHITLGQYSQLLKKLCANHWVKSAWIFCYLSPHRFFDSSLSNVTDERKIRHLRSEYPHFSVFKEMSKDPEKKVVRILHRGSDEWDSRNKAYLNAFAWVNGENISCHILDNKHIHGEDRWAISDQIVLNGELLLSFWYEDGSDEKGSLTVTYLDEGFAREGFNRFQFQCESKCTEETEYKRVMGDVCKGAHNDHPSQ